MLRRILISLACVLAISTLATVPASAQYQPNFITATPTTVDVGGTVTVTAGYFKPGSSVQITIQTPDGPITLGYLIADPNGVVTGSFPLPPQVHPAPHTISAIGPGMNTPGNLTLTLTIGVSVLGSSATTSVSNGSLPITGSGDTRPLAAIGVGLAVIGGLVVLGTRRRRPAQDS